VKNTNEIHQALAPLLNGNTFQLIAEQKELNTLSLSVVRRDTETMTGTVKFVDE